MAVAIFRKNALPMIRKHAITLVKQIYAVVLAMVKKVAKMRSVANRFIQLGQFVMLLAAKWRSIVKYVVSRVYNTYASHPTANEDVSAPSISPASSMSAESVDALVGSDANEVSLPDAATPEGQMKALARYSDMGATAATITEKIAKKKTTRAAAAAGSKQKSGGGGVNTRKRGKIPAHRRR